MPKTTEIISFVRQQMVDMLDGLSVEQLNHIPNGLRNNLVWNLAHVIAVQENYLYRKAGTTLNIDETMRNAYDNGTFPGERVEQDEIDRIKALAVSTADRLVQDVQNGAFPSFEPFPVTPRKIMLESVNDGLEFLMFHEGLHLATMGAIKRLVLSAS